ncbi:MAG: D-glycero-beta-D-manno-heptose-7-phosphate kinase [Elusimicrobia bacterium HGW-Elusimicrobia-3]|nr:MAG: D-glycero-beta-D-manno-heptose-7-phosphate kinase [Elusimicrobia bacterium HGW-Elusimicrobia-3]
MTKAAYKRLSSIVAGFRGRKIAVFGDLMLDRYVKGSVKRISPEAPVPVVRVTSESSVCGGAANVAVNLAALGASPSLVSVTGRDAPAEELTSLLAAAGVSASSLVRDGAFRTIEKTRVIAEHQQVVRFDHEYPALLGQPARRAALSSLEAALKDGCQALILSDYGKGLLEPSTIKAAIALAARRGVPVFVDPKVEHFQLYRGAACITPNTSEAYGGMRQTQKDGQEQAEKLGRDIMRRLGLRSLLITQGEHGMTLFTRKASALASTHIPTRAREVFDVTGAGDTVISTLALTWAAGATPEEAATAANFAAGIVVAKLGTASASVEELLESAKSWIKTA